MSMTRELRLGNWILLKEGKLFAKIEGILDKDKLNIFVDGNGALSGIIDINKVQPIKLTEEIILSCGFSSNGMYDNVYQFEYYHLTLNKKTKSGLLTIENDSTQLSLEVHTLHQLQNTYFILTGEDLVIGLQNP